MGTHASADAFYGAAWPADELPEKWAKEQQARWDADDYDGDDEDYGDRLENLLKELGVDSLLEVDLHGNLAYDYSGYAVVVKGSGKSFGCGDVGKLPFADNVTHEAREALIKVVEYLGRDKAEVGWVVTVTYG